MVKFSSEGVQNMSPIQLLQGSVELLALCGARGHGAWPAGNPAVSFLELEF